MSSAHSQHTPRRIVRIQKAQLFQTCEPLSLVTLTRKLSRAFRSRCAFWGLAMSTTTQTAMYSSFGHRINMLASVKDGLYHPMLPTFRRMDMDTAIHKLPEEHSRTTTPLTRGNNLYYDHATDTE